MLYLLAVIFPPAAVLMVGKPVQALLNLVLCLLYIPALIHALMVVSSHKAEQRQKALILVQQAASAQQTAAIQAQTAALLAAQQAPIAPAPPPAP